MGKWQEKIFLLTKAMFSREFATISVPKTFMTGRYPLSVLVQNTPSSGFHNIGNATKPGAIDQYIMFPGEERSLASMVVWNAW